MNGEAMSSPKVSKKLIEGGSKTKYVKAAPDKNPNRLKGAKKYTYFFSFEVNPGAENMII